MPEKGDTRYVVGGKDGGAFEVYDGTSWFAMNGVASVTVFTGGAGMPMARIEMAETTVIPASKAG